MIANIKKTVASIISLVMMLWVTAPFAMADPVECSINYFGIRFGQQTRYAHIDNKTNEIIVKAPYGTNLFNEAYAPVIEVPSGVTLSPGPDVPQYFIGDVVYTITLREGKNQIKKEYIVRVEIEDIPAMRPITVFKLNGVSGTINEFNKTICVLLPKGISKDELTAQITHTGKSVFPAAGEITDFSNGATYIVTMEDGRKIAYDVIVKTQ